jgi:hypothetical protein
MSLQFELVGSAIFNKPHMSVKFDCKFPRERHPAVGVKTGGNISGIIVESIDNSIEVCVDLFV